MHAGLNSRLYIIVGRSNTPDQTDTITGSTNHGRYQHTHVHHQYRLHHREYVSIDHIKTAIVRSLYKTLTYLTSDAVSVHIVLYLRLEIVPR